jgi:pimeloyl-ACP methyl ester carboxylesterase
MLRGDFPTQHLAQIAAPTPVLAGEPDPAFVTVYLTHQTLLGAVLKRLPSAGHLSNLDPSDAFPHPMMHFLRGIEVDSGV